MKGDIDLVFSAAERDMPQSLDGCCLPAGVYFCDFAIEVFDKAIT